RTLSGGRLDVRSWMGVDGSLPGSARRAGRGVSTRVAGHYSERARWHVELWKASPEAPALNPEGGLAAWSKDLSGERRTESPASRVTVACMITALQDRTTLTRCRRFEF